MFDDEDRASAFARLDGAHQSCRASTQDDDVVICRRVGTVGIAHNSFVVCESELVVGLR